VKYSIEDNFKASTVALVQLVNANDKFKIPEFQRPYSWKSKEQILTFLNDILDAKHSSEDPESIVDNYFIGPIITYQEGKGSENLIIDGQQRFTTIILIITALRDLLYAINSDNWSEYDGYLNYKDKSLAGSQTKASRLSLTNRDAKKYLESLIQLDESTESPIGDADNLDKAYKFIKRYVGDSQESEGLSGDEQEAMDFVNFMLNNIGLTWIRCSDLDQALMVFERMNYRGEPLSISDLIKYYLFTGQSLDDLGEDTKKIQEMWTNIKKKLEKGENTKNPKLDRFFKYFITSKYMEKGVLQEKKIIDWIKNEDKKNNLKIASDPIKFLDSLEDEMTNYVHILKKRYPEHLDVDDNIMELRRIASFGKEIRQHLPILLTASRAQYSKDDYEKLCEAIENLSFVWKVTKSQWNEVEKNLSDWCYKIRNKVPVDEIVEANILPLIQSKAKDLGNDLRNLEDKNKTLIKYMLVRMEHYLRDKMAMPKEWWNWGKGGVLELEHILAEKYTKDSVPADKKTLDDLVWRFGNLTILEPYANNTANNIPVNEKYKSEFFEKSAYVLSQTIQTEEISYKNKKATAGQRKHLTKLDHKPISLTSGYWLEKQIAAREKFYFKIINSILFGADSKQLIK
tara:strand:- start:3284 stop:5167 length:1884 start_codon:yes stop_codon:yes gene_type:complete